MDDAIVDGMPGSSPAASSVLKMFAEVRTRLVETGTRNRLVHVNRASSRGNVLNIVNERSDEVFKLLSAGKALRFKALGRDKIENTGEVVLADTDDESIGDERYTDNYLESRLGPDALQKKLLKLHREAQTAEEESGVNILYVALGFLTWFEDKSSSVPREAPRVLRPLPRAPNYSLGLNPDRRSGAKLPYLRDLMREKPTENLPTGRDDYAWCHA